MKIVLDEGFFQNTISFVHFGKLDVGGGRGGRVGLNEFKRRKG